jgi:glycosyltransferase involved in cell wall biosynthesis
MLSEPLRQPYVFDARSAGWSRTTGWERYARETAKRLHVDPLVRVRLAGSPDLSSRLWQDLAATPMATRTARVVHFPSLPPVPWSGSRHQALLYTLHDLTWWRYPETASRMGRQYYRPLARAALRRAHVITGTLAIAEEIQEFFGLPSHRVSVVPLGADLPPPIHPVGRTRPYLLAVGTVEPRKNLRTLELAYRMSGVSATHDLVLVGRLGWGDHPGSVEVIAGLDDERLAGMYAGATAVILPSLYEGFGLPVVEAMQLGVPVVCSDTPVLREVSGGFAHFVDPYDLDSLIEGVRAAVSLRPHPDAAAWSRGAWNWSRTSASLSALYRRLDPLTGDA